MKKSFVAIGAAILLGTSAVGSTAFARSTAETARLFDRVEIGALLATYLYDLDHGQTAKLADMFTDDGVLDVSPAPQRGREAIRDYYAKRSSTRTTRHVSTNLVLTFDDPNHAHAIHTLTYYMGEGPGPLSSSPAGVADYAEVFVRGSDSKWRFAYRKPTPVFGTGSGPKAPQAK